MGNLKVTKYGAAYWNWWHPDHKLTAGDEVNVLAHRNCQDFRVEAYGKELTMNVNCFEGKPHPH